MIGLIDILKAEGIGINIDDMKIHLACWNGREDPIDVYYAGGFKEWQERQGRRNFKCDQVLSLIDLGNGCWLFAGVFQIQDCKPHPKYEGEFLYSTQMLPRQSDLVGRIIVSHKRTGRASYIWYRDEMALTVAEIRRERMTVAEFPGYNAVVISHSTLKIITGQKIESWYGALANIKGVYLITDTSTGKHYIGKASGQDGIWQRWCSYADNGHGGNKELKALLKSKGARHMARFQYSILEIADTHASDEDILKRESYWMSALRTREFGLNGACK
jgi:hypothetical protein